jgi:histidine ammonia-lyase
MTVMVESRADLTLAALSRVAWDGERVEIGPRALAVMDRCHDSFKALVEALQAADPGAMVYGVTTGPGDWGGTRLAEEALASRPKRVWTAASFGEPLPPRAVRAIVFARLANLVEGHAAARGEVARAVAALLEADNLPAVPAEGNGGAGEILALGHLFYELSGRLELTAKERMALINGSPCAAALVADVALAGGGRLELAEQVLALSADALNVPLEAYSELLEPLWGDEHDSAALRSLRALLEGGEPGRQGHQAPVSSRILPRVLGQVRRALAEAEAAAAISLRSVTDNPVYTPPDDSHPLGSVFSTGGYHNARATAAIDGMAFAWADLCQLAQRHTDKLFQHPATAGALSEEWTYKPLHMVQAGWANQARLQAQPSLIGLGAFGQNDVPAMSFAAWRKAVAIGRCLDACLAVLAALASRALQASDRPGPPALNQLTRQVAEVFPPITGERRIGPDCEALAASFASQIFKGRIASRLPSPSRGG